MHMSAIYVVAIIEKFSAPFMNRRIAERQAEAAERDY